MAGNAKTLRAIAESNERIKKGRAASEGSWPLARPVEPRRERLRASELAAAQNSGPGFLKY